MKSPTRVLCLVAVLSCALSLRAQDFAAGKPSHQATPSPTERARASRMRVSYAQLPLSFEPNQGQAAEPARFLSRGRGYTLFLDSTDMVLALRRERRVSPQDRVGGGPGESAGPPAALRIRLLGAHAPASIEPGDLLPGKSNYFIGNDPKKWRRNVPNYGRVRYRNIYPCIYLVYYGNQRQLEHDFEVAPGAKPGKIRLALEGARGLRLEESG